MWNVMPLEMPQMAGSFWPFSAMASDTGRFSCVARKGAKPPQTPRFLESECGHTGCSTRHHQPNGWCPNRHVLVYTGANALIDYFKNACFPDSPWSAKTLGYGFNF